MHPMLTDAQIEQYQRDGVTIVRGLFADHVETLRAGVERNMAAPGPYASENEKAGESGRFFDDYCNWQRIPEFESVIRESAAAEVAAGDLGYVPRDLMRFAGNVLRFQAILDGLADAGIVEREGDPSMPVFILEAGKRY